MRLEKEDVIGIKELTGDKKELMDRAWRIVRPIEGLTEKAKDNLSQLGKRDSKRLAAALNRLLDRQSIKNND